MVGVGPHGGGGSSGGRFVRIRDNMDDILEARRLFRKHVAEDNNSIYRAVSDALWGTQVRTYCKKCWIRSKILDSLMAWLA